MLAVPLIVGSLLAADGGAPWDELFLHVERRCSEVHRRCVELVASASESEAADPALAVSRADAATTLAAPVRDEVSVLLLVPGGGVHAMGAAKTERLQALTSQLLECVRSADFLIVRVRRASQKKSPGSASARKEAEASFKEYVERYRKHPTAQAVNEWLQELGPK